MSTVETRIKAAKALIKMRTDGDKRFPKIFILGEKTCPFINPLRRLVGDMNCEIEEMNIHEAFMILYSRPMTPEEFNMVDWNMNQAGALFNGQLYNPEGYIRRRRDNDGGRPEEVEFTPMDKNWQEKRDGIAVDEESTEQTPATEEATAESPESEDEPEMLNAEINFDKLDARSRDTLQYAGCATYRDLINLGRAKMLTYRNYGKKSLVLLDEHLEVEGLADYWFGQKQLKTIKK